MSTSNSTRALKFNARYLPILAAVAPKNDVRYYLNGFYVTPHESGKGAYLVATDGHHMIVIYDESAETNGDWICSISQKLVTQAKKKGSGRHPLFNGSGAIQYVSNTVYVVNKALSEMDMPPGIFEVNGKQGDLTKNVLHCEFSKPIEGEYPDFRRVIPEKADKDQIPLFNPTYLEFSDAIKKQLGDPRVNAAKLFGNGHDQSMIVRFPRHPEVLGLIMPMREDEEEKLNAIPDWLIRINEESEKTKAA